VFSDSTHLQSYLFYLTKKILKKKCVSLKKICVSLYKHLQTSTTSSSSPFHRPQQLFPNLYTPSLPRPTGPLSLHPGEPPVVRRFPPISCFIGPGGALSKRVCSCIDDRSIQPSNVSPTSSSLRSYRQVDPVSLDPSDSSELLVASNLFFEEVPRLLWCLVSLFRLAMQH
jgi:hypothetical protein